MKLLLAALLLMSTHVFPQQTEIPLQYQLEIVDGKFHVDLLYKPYEKDSSKFTYGLPPFGGQLDIVKGLQNIRVASPARFTMDSVNRSVTFYYNGFSPLGISYDIADTRTVANTRSQLFRPMILPDYFFIHGVNLFLTPAFRVADTNPRVSVQWKTLPGFPIFYTFDPDNNGTRPTVTTSDSISLRFMTGARDLTVKTFSNESGTNYLVLRSTGMTTAVTAELEDFYVMYNSVMRQFWRDKRKIKYSLVLQPYLDVKHKMSGVSFGNGFIGKYDKPDSLAKGERKFVIAHEIGHYYLGDLEAFAGESSEGQWFNEGFNDYTTFFNLLRAKSITPEEFETEFNRILRQLYNSPIKNTPNNKIFENFWKLGDYAKLPYWRGCVYAFYLDNQISLKSKGKNSLQDLMLDLKDIVNQRAKKEFTNEEFIHACSKYLPYNQVSTGFDEYIVKGTSIPFDNSMLLPIFTITTLNQSPILKIVNRKNFISHYRFRQP